MKQLFILAALVLLAGCDNGTGKPLTIQKTENKYEVTLLFEHNGCKIYSFWDGRGARTVYYSDCSGSVYWKESKHVDQSVSTSANDSISNLK